MFKSMHNIYGKKYAVTTGRPVKFQNYSVMMDIFVLWYMYVRNHDALHIWTLYYQK